MHNSIFKRFAAILAAAAVALSLTACEAAAGEAAQQAGELISAAQYAAEQAQQQYQQQAAPAEENGAAAAQPQTQAEPYAQTGGIKLHFIDVGQALSVLVECGGQYMLYDGGNVDDGSAVVEYLKNHGAARLEYVFGSHAHEDHIGGLSAVLRSPDISVGHVYSPVTEAEGSACFDYFAADTAAAGLALEVPAVGTVWQLGGATVRLLGPVREYEAVNNTSLVLRIDYGSASFLLTGDMERDAERDLVESGADLKADVLQAGHHGSSDATSYILLNAVLPEMAVISCGTNNDYGHPHEELLSRLRDAGVDTYRTDLMGTITVESDGESYTVGYERAASDEALNPTLPSSEAMSAGEYIGNVNSKKFHLPTCADLPAEKNRVTFTSYEQAVAAGYSPHSGCIK